MEELRVEEDAVYRGVDNHGPVGRQVNVFDFD